MLRLSVARTDALEKKLVKSFKKVAKPSSRT